MGFEWVWSWNLIRIRKREYKELLEKADKLEAIREWYNYIYNHSDVPGDDFLMPEDSMLRLREILEVEDR